MQGVLDAADKDAILRCVKLRVRHALCALNARWALLPDHDAIMNLMFSLCWQGGDF